MVALVKRVLGRLIKGFFRPGFGLCFALCFGGAKAADFVVAEHLGAQCSMTGSIEKWSKFSKVSVDGLVNIVQIVQTSKENHNI